MKPLGKSQRDAASSPTLVLFLLSRRSPSVSSATNTARSSVPLSPEQLAIQLTEGEGGGVGRVCMCVMEGGREEKVREEER